MNKRKIQQMLTSSDRELYNLALAFLKSRVTNYEEWRSMKLGMLNEIRLPRGIRERLKKELRIKGPINNTNDGTSI